MRFESKPVAEHEDVPVADEGRLDEVVEKWARRSGTISAEGEVRAYVISAGDFRDEHQQRGQLAEILGLVDALGHEVVGHESLRVKTPHPRTFFGKGTCEAIAGRARAAGATLLVLDVQLSPSQTRDLEDATGLSIADREGVILEVFMANARSKEARIQVQIAHLEYLRPRIRGLGIDMDQQAGGVIGGRGAGETASELLARQLDDRMVRLRKELSRIAHAGERRRERREDCARIALVGYTNAGKTSLMNALCGTSLSARARPFETLDTTSRCLTRHGGDVVIGDTVGFIRDLPERLVSSFESTFAKARDATLLVVVVDVSDPEWPLHMATTSAQLDRLDGFEGRRFVVYNKADRAPDVVRGELAQAADPWPWTLLSAHDPDAIDALRDALVRAARGDGHRREQLFVPYAATAVSADLYRTCRVLAATASDGGMLLTVEGPAHRVAQLAARLGEGA
jgi:GTPase